MLRFIDFLISLLSLILLSPIIALALSLSWLATGHPIFQQRRIGKNGKEFILYKVRTMPINMRDMPTHLVDQSNLTPICRFLRKTKLDESLQLWNVVLGDMSLVGPRPCLPIQTDIIRARRAESLLSIAPGVTGPSQISGIDMSTPELLIEADKLCLQNQTASWYFKILVITARSILRGK